MLMLDNSDAMIDAEVAKCKASTKLNPDNQMQPDSGYFSAPDPGGVDQSAAVPSGSPGTGGYKENSSHN